MLVKSSSVKTLRLPGQGVICTCEAVIDCRNLDLSSGSGPVMIGVSAFERGRFALSLRICDYNTHHVLHVMIIAEDEHARAQEMKGIVLLLKNHDQCVMKCRGQLRKLSKPIHLLFSKLNPILEQLTEKEKGELRVWVGLRFPIVGFGQEALFASDSSLVDTSSNCLTSELKLLPDFDAFSDTAIKIGDKLLSCHKFILSTRSEVLKAMFKSELSSQTSVIDWTQFEDVSEKSAVEFRRFLYTDQVKDLDEIDLELLQIADYYQVFNLSLICAQSLYKGLASRNVEEVFRVTARLASHNLPCRVLCQAAKEWIQLWRPLFPNVSDGDLDAFDFGPENLSDKI